MARDTLDTVTALGDATRRGVYEHVSTRDAPVARDEVAAALGIGRTLAAYHLDRLAEAGLLEVSYRRRSGRSGPGAGRPAKLYGRAGAEVTVSFPPRDYGLAARLLADAAASDSEGSTRRALRDAAERLGSELADESPGTPAEDRLAARGYEPRRDPRAAAGHGSLAGGREAHVGSQRTRPPVSPSTSARVFAAREAG
jgi:predicted ArsR family transcriptional regulator